MTAYCFLEKSWRSLGSLRWPGPYTPVAQLRALSQLRPSPLPSGWWSEHARSRSASPLGTKGVSLENILKSTPNAAQTKAHKDAAGQKQIGLQWQLHTESTFALHLQFPGRGVRGEQMAKVGMTRDRKGCCWLL